jgi:type IV pilus assembly protein PilA
VLTIDPAEHEGVPHVQQMLANLKARRRDEEGFTLIELMVVVLIIAILIAIAIPTFLGARQRAQERAAQSSVRNALTASKTLFTDSENYNNTTAAGLEGVEPSLEYFDGGDVSDAAVVTNTGPNNISFHRVDTDADTNMDQITLAARSNNGECFAVREQSVGASAGTTYAQWTASAANGCEADAVPAGTTFGDAW